MNPLRSLAQTTILILSLAESLFRFFLMRTGIALMHRRTPIAAERAQWLHGCCKRILKRLGLQLTTNAALPARGLVVSNHLSHLDILLYGSLGPILFIAKHEVRRWPLLGRLAACGATVFVDREHPAQAAIAAKQIAKYLRGDLPVLLFAEGTSSDGSAVLPFRSSLFEPAIQARAAITCAAIRYSAEGVDEAALTYWGDKVFFPHLFTTLGRGALGGTILLGSSKYYASRKDAARISHDLVTGLRNSQNTSPSSTMALPFVVQLERSTQQSSSR